ncbi:sugar phosphate isomerase/epimerase [Croceitalea sp. MTPC9]|uniref:sugar phosphate isomerase/epimerase family protein n=1 Tax=unclassified Croceitalea TaxID=2632280 RepID=UPI002B3C41F5|nr:sugar phosphate isomerase/epimerase [Croceitalea sp. MTPC6]GMN15711.1 sugar phosphate isomerase/epimerase [Croceitalea sp. MTPC9]
MSRRQFIKQSGTLTAVSIIPISCFSTSDKSKYKMGLQAFTIRDAMKRDLIGSLKTVKSLGYEDLELYGFNSVKETYYGHSTSDFKKILSDIGLTASSCHYGFSDYFEASPEELKTYVDKCIKTAKELDLSYVTWPWLQPKYRTIENFKLLVEKLNRIGEQVNSSGLGFAYHNHDFEFLDHNGEIGYDIIMSRTDPSLVKLQLDLYWAVQSSKLNPVELIAKDPKRFVMWHIKDMDKVTRDYSELGNGSIDYHKMLSQLDQSGLEYYYLEQGGNFATNSIQSITDSANYFKTNLQQYL